MIQFIPETGSTNADLAARLRAGEALAEGDWLVADRQLAGKGRLGRVWQDGAGNFMGSTVVRPGHGDPPLPTLALVAGLAVQDAAAQFLTADAPLMLKWPNDLLAGGAKLAGILMETCGQAVVIGLGVNLAQAPAMAERPVTSLAALGGRAERDDFAAALATSFDRELERWRTFGLEPLIKRWCQAAHPPGTPLVVHTGHGEPVRGAFNGLDAQGALQLRLADGTAHVIHAGDVSLAKRD